MFHLLEKLRTGDIYVIAEMSANHGGSLDNALKLVKEAARAGADCLKIQTYTADSMTMDCDNDYFRIKGGLWDGYRLYDLYQEAGTPYGWQKRIKRECERCGIDFLSTPFDKDAVDFLETLNIEAYKIASFELVDIPLIEYAASKGKPMLISTGMGSIEEIQDALDACRRMGNEHVVLLKCCSEYPASWADMHLGNIPDMMRRFKVPVGLSDHGAGSLGAVVGVTLGACVVEKHIKLDGVESADGKFSMTVGGFAQMVKDVRNARLIAQGPEYALTDGERESTAFRRSIFAAKDVKAGEAFTSENLRVIRPGYGIAPKYLKELIGEKSHRDIKRGEPITKRDLKRVDAKTGDEELYLRSADEKDLWLLFRWANDVDARRNSFHEDEIRPDEHERWFSDLLRDENQKQYILIHEKEPVGQIRISICGEEAEIDYSIEPTKRGLGYGKIIVNMMQQKIRDDFPTIKKLTAKVKPSNAASIYCFERNRFEEVYHQFEFNM